MLPTLQFLGLTGLATVRRTSLLLSFTLSVYFLSKTIKIEIDRQTAWKAPASATTMTLAVLATQNHMQQAILATIHSHRRSSLYSHDENVETLDKEDTQLIKEIAGEKSAKS